MSGAFLPYGRQCVDEADIAAVTAVLRSDWLTQGPLIERFEKRVAEYCGVKHAVAVANGTAALHIAVAALGLKEGDSLWTSPNTFVASANCARYCGANVDFIDIDPATYNLSNQKLEEKLAAASVANNLPKAVVAVHFAGQSCEMRRISELAGKYGFAVIEDAAHALGATFRGKPVGNCQFSDMATFSFHPVKIITTAEGGMVVTNRTDLYERLLLLRSHGITRDERLLEGESHGPWYYEQVDLGWNYRLTDVHCALGLSQMDKLDKFVARRREIAPRYDELLREFPVVTPFQEAETESSWHLYVIRLQLDKISKSRREVVVGLREKGIGAQIHYIPVHTQPYYRKLGFKGGDFPEAEKYYEEAISLPIFPTMTDGDQDRVVEMLRSILA
jgi:UDP-4-amino-4,6-dideoxy-N-acetyl-beta-L-altrosamine transaminase